MLDYTMLQLVNKGMYIPPDVKEQVLKDFGMFTMNDFDKYFYLNDALGRPYDNCYASIMSIKPLAKAYFKCLDPDMQIMFNLVQSAIRSPLGEKVWF